MNNELKLQLEKVKELISKLTIDLTKVFIVAKLVITDELNEGLTTDSGTI